MRPTKSEYFMHLAYAVATAGTCDRRRVGCVVVDQVGHILTTGYNGAEAGMPHCDQVGHLLVAGRCRRTIHAEQNAVVRGKDRGVSMVGGIAYCTIHPCWRCVEKLSESGVLTVVYDGDYHPQDGDDQDARDTAARVGLSLVKFEGGPWWDMTHTDK